MEDDIWKAVLDGGVDFLHIVVDRADIESGNIEKVLQTLFPLFASVEMVRRFRSAVDLSIHGYNEDQRELFEIEEVSAFLRRLDEAFPYWFYFASLQGQFLSLLIIVQCKFERKATRQPIIDKYDWALFLEKHFAAMNTIFDKYGLDESLNEALSKAIIDYYEGRQNFQPIN